jgi:hypothetical protein
LDTLKKKLASHLQLSDQEYDQFKADVFRKMLIHPLRLPKKELNKLKIVHLNQLKDRIKQEINYYQHNFLVEQNALESIQKELQHIGDHNPELQNRYRYQLEVQQKKLHSLNHKNSSHCAMHHMLKSIILDKTPR